MLTDVKRQHDNVWLHSSVGKASHRYSQLLFPGISLLAQYSIINVVFNPADKEILTIATTPLNVTNVRVEHWQIWFFEV